MSRVAREIDRKLLFESFSQRYERGSTNRAALKSSSSRRDIRRPSRAGNPGLHHRYEGRVAWTDYGDQTYAAVTVPGV